MKISIYSEPLKGIELSTIADGIGSSSSVLAVRDGGQTLRLADELLTNPGSYESLPRWITEETQADDLAVLFTERPYENNYFWDTPDRNRVILSLYGWDHLTRLPRNNGVVLFICALIVRHLRIGSSHKKKNTGCLNDYWQDKTGVDGAMRSAYICDECIRGTSLSVIKKNEDLLDDLQRILDQLSATSRLSRDICDVWRVPRANVAFDVFLCHNSHDKPTVRQLNKSLTKKGIRTWLDEEQLPPGRPWQDLLESQIQSVRSAAVLVGQSGLGPWQDVEARAFLQQFVARQCPVIPVILKDCGVVPTLPVFLSQLTWVDFRRRTPSPMDRLVWGITGKRPMRSSPSTGTSR